jgi:hypothetical protein
MGETQSALKILYGKSEGKRALGDIREDGNVMIQRDNITVWI